MLMDVNPQRVAVVAARTTNPPILILPVLIQVILFPFAATLK